MSSSSFGEQLEQYKKNTLLLPSPVKSRGAISSSPVLTPPSLASRTC